jgi:hypothetical protein
MEIAAPSASFSSLTQAVIALILSILLQLEGIRFVPMETDDRYLTFHLPPACDRG